MMNWYTSQTLFSSLKYALETDHKIRQRIGNYPNVEAVNYFKKLNTPDQNKIVENYKLKLKNKYKEAWFIN
jgi:hypothetical protein